MPYQVSQLLTGVGAPVTATVDEPIQTALDRMLHHDFSQLPVVKGIGQQRQFYFITYKSILLALHTFGNNVADSGLHVEDALVKVPTVYRATDDLFDLLVVMREMNAALIVDDDQSLTHIVTNYDTTRYFREWAEDIMQVRDVERSLKRIINSAFRKPDGEIDEAARQAAIEETTSANRVLRKKFGAAIKQYGSQQAAVPVVPKPEWVDIAFAELVKGRDTLAVESAVVPEGVEIEGQADSAVVTSDEADTAELIATTQKLRRRFEAGLKCYLAQQAGEFSLVDSFVDDAFKMIYDRSEKVREFGELTLDSYIQLFFKEQCWDRYKSAIKREEAEVKHMLEGVRDTRNILAHFREEQVTAQKRLQLKFCADWLSERERAIDALGEVAAG